MPQKIREWNKLDTSICQAPSYSVFRKALFNFIQPTAISTFGTNDVSGSKLLIRLRVGFSHLRDHKFKHNFQDTMNLLCHCSLEAEDTYHFFMPCQNCSNQRLVDYNLNSFTSSIRFIKDSKRFDESHSSWEKSFWYIFTMGIKIRKYFFTFCISVLYNLSAVKMCVCV